MSPSEIAWVQRRLGLHVTGTGDLTVALREFQKSRGLVITGILDAATEAALASVPTEGLVPAWYQTDIADVIVASRIGGCDEASIRRFQSAARLPLTGRVDEATAVRIGD